MDITCGPLLAHPHPPAHQQGTRTVSSDAQTGTLPGNSGAGRQTRGQCSYLCSCSRRQRPRLPTTASSGPKPVLRSRNHRARPRHDFRGTHTIAGANPAAVRGRSMPNVPMPRLYTAQEPAAAAGIHSSTHTAASISLQSTTAGVMHHTAVGAGVRAHHAASPRVAGGCDNSHRGAAAAHLSPQNAAPNSKRRGRSTPAHRMYTSGAPPPAPGICSTHPISSSVSRSRRGPMHGVQMGEGDAHPFACAPARIRLQGGQADFFGAGRGRVVSPPRGVVPDRTPVPSVGGAVGTAARRPAPAGQLVIVIGELGAALRLFRERRSLERQSIF
jgi:hypothetical protein